MFLAQMPKESFVAVPIWLTLIKHIQYLYPLYSKEEKIFQSLILHNSNMGGGSKRA
jgi:hypothetical protein